MTKKIAFLLLTLVLLFTVSACSKKTNQQSVNSKAKNTQASKVKSISGSLKSLMSRGQDLKCTYSAKDPTSSEQMKNVLYISNNKSLTESELIGADQNMKVSVLIDGDNMYSWSNLSKQGTKSNLKKMKEDDLAENSNEEFAAVYNKDNDYKCSSWKRDDSKFKVPSDIKFIDLNEVMNGLGGTTKEGASNSNFNSKQKVNGADVCKMCNMISDQTQKSKCLASANCE